MTPNARIYVSALWERFLPRLGTDKINVTDIPDEGMEIPITDSFSVTAVPAHFLHSPGNFHYYDKKARVYFSGDVGAAVFPPGK